MDTGEAVGDLHRVAKSPASLPRGFLGLKPGQLQFALRLLKMRAQLPSNSCSPTG